MTYCRTDGHEFCLKRRAEMLQPTEVMVIDAPAGAPWALDAYRPQHERAHVLCRVADEPAVAFVRRVMKRLHLIGRGAEVAGLTLVLGSDPTLNTLMPELSHALASILAPSGFLTLVGVGACQSDVAAWVESFRSLVEPSVALGAWFPPRGRHLPG